MERAAPTGRQGHAALWSAFVAVHVALAAGGRWLAPRSAQDDLRIYRDWVVAGLHGAWPVLDVPWVYPGGALAVLLVASAAGTAAFWWGWMVLVTVLDGVAFALALRRPGGTRAGAWWLVFLVALGPVALARLDAVVVALMSVALLVGIARPRTAAVLLAAGGWIKVTPGLLLLALAATTRRWVRDVVGPAAALSVVVAGGLLALGAGSRLWSFLGDQTGRGLQVEAVAATPWVLAAPFTDRVRIEYDRDLNTYEVLGPGAAGAARLLDVVMLAGVVAVVALLWRRRRALDGAGVPRVAGGPDAAGTTPWVELLARGALALVLLLVVANKVGSPQYVTWFAPPVVAALAATLPGWRRTAAGLLVVAALTQVVFPWGYTPLLHAAPVMVAVLAVRNVLVVALLVATVHALVAGPARAPSARASTRAPVDTRAPASGD